MTLSAYKCPPRIFSIILRRYFNRICGQVCRKVVDTCACFQHCWSIFACLTGQFLALIGRMPFQNSDSESTIGKFINDNFGFVLEFHLLRPTKVLSQCTFLFLRSVKSSELPNYINVSIWSSFFSINFILGLFMHFLFPKRWRKMKGEHMANTLNILRWSEFSSTKSI